MRRTGRPGALLARGALLTVCGALLTACTTSPPVDPPTTPEPLPSTSGTATDAPTTTPTQPEPSTGPSTLSGQVIVRQDVTGLPDQPLREGSLFAVPASAADRLWAEVGIPRPADLMHAHGAVTDAAVVSAGGIAIALDQDGRFSADVAAGEHVLCLRAFPDTRITGCGTVTAPQEVTVLTGQVPFLLEPPQR